MNKETRQLFPLSNGNKRSRDYGEGMVYKEFCMRHFPLQNQPCMKRF